MDPILDIIDEALRRKGLSDAAASKLAVGNYALIKNMRSSRSDEKRYSFQSLERLADVLGLECYFGLPRDADPVPGLLVDGKDYAQIPVHAAALAAGSGLENDADHIIDYLAFRRDWLRKIGVSPANAVLARAEGDSMQPCIWDGDMLLIDKSRTEPPPQLAKDAKPRRAPVFALLDDGAAKVKRIQIAEAGMAILISDNPDYPPQFTKTETLTIIGKVLWWGHTNRG